MCWPFNRVKLSSVLSWEICICGSPQTSPSPGPHPKAGPGYSLTPLSYSKCWQALGCRADVSRRLPACLLGSHTPSPPCPRPLQAHAHMRTLGQPWGPEQMFLCACLPAPSPRTHMCIHEHTHTPTHTTAAWVVLNDCWISCHNRSCLPSLPLSSFPRSFPSKHCSNLHVPHPLSYTPAQDRLGPTRSLLLFVEG